MSQKPTSTPENKVQFVFGKSNYQFLVISIAIVIIGFALMTGDNDIYDFRKTVLAPIVVLAGFALGFYAILKKSTPKSH